MTSVRTTLLLGAALATGLAVVPIAGQTPLKKAERDELAIVAKNDPTMAAAMAKARQTLPEFLALAAAPKPGMDTFSVKVAVREGRDSRIFLDCAVHEQGRHLLRGDQQQAALGPFREVRRDHHLRAIGDRRLDVYGRRQDEGQLHRLCAAQVGQQTGGRRVQEALWPRL
jgi:hypothetical protein